jgi:hypothetical protein
MVLSQFDLGSPFAHVQRINTGTVVALRTVDRTQKYFLKDYRYRTGIPLDAKI